MNKPSFFRLMTIILVLSLFTRHTAILMPSNGVKDVQAAAPNINVITGLFRSISALNARNRIYSEANATAAEVNAYYDAQIATAQSLRQERISAVTSGEKTPASILAYIRASAALENERQAMLQMIEAEKNRARQEFNQSLSNEIKNTLLASPGGQTILTDVRSTIRNTREAAVALQSAANSNSPTRLLTEALANRLGDSRITQELAQTLGSDVGNNIDRALGGAITKIEDALDDIKVELGQAIAVLDELDASVAQQQEQVRSPVSPVGNSPLTSIITPINHDSVGVDVTAFAYTVAADRAGNLEPGATRASMLDQIRSVLLQSWFNELMDNVDDLRPGFVYCRNVTVDVYEVAASGLGMAVQIAKDPDQARYLVCYDIQTDQPVLASISGEILTAEDEGIEDTNIEEGNDDVVVETDPLSMTWEGEANLIGTSKEACAVCLPPTYTGNLVLTVDMKTYAFEGSVTFEGEGQATMNQCDSEGNPTNNTCIGQGTGYFTGTFSGITDSTGIFSVDFKSEGTTTMEWVVGCGAPISVTGSGENATRISGTINWEGTSEGTIILTDGRCYANGEWSAELVAIEYPQEHSP